MGTDIDTIARLRQEVGRLRAYESRRIFDAGVHVGTLGGPRSGFVLRAQDLPVVDPGLRVEVVTALLAGAGAAGGTAWLVRPGRPDLHDLDLQWLAAATLAFGIHGRRLDGFYAITRVGWLDVRSGDQKVWKRLRL